MHQSASERARLRRGVPPAMVPDATPFCSGWGGAPEPEPEPSWLAAAAVRKAAGSKACSTCGERGHLRYACPVRLAALNAAQSITAAEQRLAWARLLQFDSSGTDSPEQLPRRVLERVVQLLPPIATPKVTARGGLWAEPGSAATSHWHSAEARSSRRAKLQRQRQRRQAEERAQRHAEWDGMEKAERSAWFNAKELAKAAQRELVAAAAAAAAVGGGGVIRVVVDLGYDAVMNDKEHRSTAQQCMLCWAALRRARSPCALTLSPVVPGSPTERALQAAGVESWVVNTTSHSVFDRPACIFPQRTDGDAQSTARMTVVYLSPDAELPLEGVSADTVYVIGGLVDRAVIAGSSLRRAQSLAERHGDREAGTEAERGDATQQAIEVETRRLPLREHIGPQVKPILNISTVFEILQRLADGSSWPEALGCLPARKQRARPSSAQRGTETRGTETRGTETRGTESEQTALRDTHGRPL